MRAFPYLGRDTTCRPHIEQAKRAQGICRKRFPRTGDDVVFNPRQGANVLGIVGKAQGESSH